MRTVAAMVAILGVIALFPLSAADDCNVSTSPAHVCQKIDVPWPGTPVPQLTVFGTYYLWVGPGHCVPPTANDCRGVPAGTGSTAGVAGILYQESNNHAGLQRAQFLSNGVVQPDRMVLI